MVKEVWDMLNLTKLTAQNPYETCIHHKYLKYLTEYRIQHICDSDTLIFKGKFLNAFWQTQWSNLFYISNPSHPSCPSSLSSKLKQYFICIFLFLLQLTVNLSLLLLNKIMYMIRKYT